MIGILGKRQQAVAQDKGAKDYMSVGSDHGPLVDIVLLLFDRAARHGSKHFLNAGRSWQHKRGFVVDMDQPVLVFDVGPVRAPILSSASIRLRGWCRHHRESALTTSVGSWQIVMPTQSLPRAKAGSFPGVIGTDGDSGPGVFRHVGANIAAWGGRWPATHQSDRERREK